jgi:hypothetical protein
MTAAQLEALEETETVDVIRWRLSQLTRSGYPLEEAVAVATRLDIDLHRASGLVDRGCPPELALRILL